MNFLRHPALAVWTAIAAAVVALVVVAVQLGSGPAPEHGPLAGAPVAAAADSAAGDEVEALRVLMASGLAAGTDVPALQAFGQRAITLTGSAVAARTAEGAGSDDPLLVTLTRAASAAQAIAGATDPTSAVAARSALGLHVDTASALLAGLPMPAGGQAAPGHALPTGGAAVPSVAVPVVPALPGLPTPTPTATLPTLGGL